MTFAWNRRLSTAVSSLAAVAATASGCSTQPQPAAPAPQASSPSVTSASGAPTPPATVTQFAPQWMTLATAQPSNWQESDRRITSELQQFGLRPIDENENPRRCNGCGVKPPTAFLTIFAPGKFDATEAQTGEPVTVNADNDGFFRASQGSEDAVLAWQYEPNAWATVHARTTMTSELDRMLELAHAIRPTELTPIRVPLSLPNVPAPMSLAEINVERDDYGTTLHFAACGRTEFSGTPDCYGETDTMRVQIWPADGYFGHIQEKNSVPAKIGGRDGIYDERGTEAAVQVQPGILVVFSLSGPFGSPPTPPKAKLKDILATLDWAPDPGNEQTWQPVSDWAKVH
jgi:hypothetical protein